MPSQQPLDAIPLLLFVPLLIGANLLAYEGGYRVGLRAQRARSDDGGGPTGMIVGSVLALMAFLLAITMGMASDRFNARRSLVVKEAQAIATGYLRAGYLPEPASSDSRDLWREYLALRITSVSNERLAANIARSEDIQDLLWTIGEDLARQEDSSLVALYLESVNSVIGLHQERVNAGIYSRVPITILWLLIVGVVLSLGLVGYQAGLVAQHSMVSATVLAILLTGVMWMILDLERPRDGLIPINQQPLVDLLERVDSMP
ncbi:MAG: hypothetical protein IT341_05710 [Chloroflexi bacterium]|nr:hypothetical protein [Chloroflexota bacterium]